MFFPIFLVILALATLVLAYFASRTWHWSHVLVVVLLFFSTLWYLVLASELLRIQAIYRSQVNRREQQIERLDPKLAALQHGTLKAEEIRLLEADGVEVPEGAEKVDAVGDLDHKLHLEIRRRGRVWRGVMPAGPIDPDTSAVNVVIESPHPHGVDPDSIVFLFEQGEPAVPDPTQGAQYLGEFRVTAAGENQVSLSPVLQLDEFEQQRLATSRGPWAMHETLPADRHDLFTGLDEEQLRQLLPPQSVEQYIRHGTEAGPDDDQWHRVGYDEDGNRLGPEDIDQAVTFRYERDLRDYGLYFHDLARQRVQLLADTAAVTEDLAKLQAALESAENLQAFRNDQLERLRRDLDAITTERTVIDSLLSIVESQVAQGQARLNRTLEENSRLADRLASLQTQLAERINRQTSDRGAAEAGTGQAVAN